MSCAKEVKAEEDDKEDEEDGRDNEWFFRQTDWMGRYYGRDISDLGIWERL